MSEIFLKRHCSVKPHLLKPGVVQRKMLLGHIYILRLFASTGIKCAPLSRAAAAELDWNVEISIDTAENLIVVAVPEDQDDMIAETTFDFYSLIAKQLDTEVFKAINFFFISDSD